MAKTKDKKKKGDGGGGLQAVIHKGISKNRTSGKKFSGSGKFRLKLDDNKVMAVQFLTTPEDFREIDQHQWREGKFWRYVPCAGKNCPLCADDDEDISKVNYRFFALVYSFRDKEIKVLEGPKTLAGKIGRSYSRNKKAKEKFLQRTWDVCKINQKGEQTTYDFDLGDMKPRPPKRLGEPPITLDQYINDALSDYFGSDIVSGSKKGKKGGKDSLDDVDSDALDDEDWDEDDDEPKKKGKKSSSKKAEPKGKGKKDAKGKKKSKK